MRYIAFSTRYIYTEQCNSVILKHREIKFLAKYLRMYTYFSIFYFFMLLNQYNFLKKCIVKIYCLYKIIIKKK